MEGLFQGLPIWLNFVLFFIGMAVITKAGDYFTDAAVHISVLTRIPKVLIGATIVSVCTTCPEFAVSFLATVQGKGVVAIGNNIGSCVINIGLICGTSTLIRPVSTSKKLMIGQGAFMLSAGILVYLLSIGGALTRLDGAILMVGLICYLYYSIKMARTERKSVEDTENLTGGEKGVQEVSLLKQFMILVLGAFGIIIGSSLLVGNVTPIAKFLGVPDLIIALTLVALGTSLPEYVVAITAAIKKHGDLSVGNILGADILNIFWILGSCSLYSPLSIPRQTMVLDYPFMIFLMVLLVTFGYTKSRIERWEGGAMFAVIIFYLTFMMLYFT
ncbi:MAG: calcium/sodium antiporter [Deltaproteobacteria bacterium]|nr:calcium/sodium antiporter [Deltaproteobacteria bacterium]